MPTIAYNAFADYLSRAAAADWPAVTLVCGEEMLCKKACEGILAALVPPVEKAIGVEHFDGGEEPIGGVLSSMNTYALLSGTKVVVLQDARFFYSAKAQQGLREKMVQAARSGDMKKASRPFLNLMAIAGLAFEDLAAPVLRLKVVDHVDGEPPSWFSSLVAYCRENGLRIPERQDDSDLLKTAMEKGFPDGHRLVMTTDFVDRRKALFKIIHETGLVVDCTVPKGETRANRMAQDTAMQATMDDALTLASKRMAVDARQRLMQWTGFDLRTLAGSLEKLISFVGDRETISDADVTTVLRRTRKDPIFEFTNAVADRDLPAILFFTHSLLEDGIHPLQLLAAVANQLRRLLLAKDFIVRDRGRSWNARMTFPQFKTGPFKAVQADDAASALRTEGWADLLNPLAEGKKRKKAVASDLVLAKNPKSPFPVFQTLKKAGNYSIAALTSAMVDLSQIDLRMKSTGQDPRVLLETFLIGLCRKAGG
ncbi:DNA polymerase III subunit delta [Desulfosarcina sp.]|uniref:DNA polymerase III subunit delta n=1 Tax=Desulfosarcina sp. TaxID=2027861 RepID=UPI003566D461